MNLLVHQIGVFEQKTYPMGKTAPSEMVAFLLEQKGLKPIALGKALGSRGQVSEILSAKRSISKEQAKKLGEFFNVSAAAFV